MDDTTIPKPLEVSVDFDGGLDGSLSATVSLGDPPPPKPPSWRNLLLREDAVTVLKHLVRVAIELGSQLVDLASTMFRRRESPGSITK